MRLRIPITKDFSFQECAHFLGRNQDEILYHFEGAKISRLLRSGEQFFPCEIIFRDDHIQVNCNEDADKKYIFNYIQKWFDTQRDLSAFYQILEQHKSLKPLLDHKGLRIIGVPDLFESLCWTIIGQQINLTFAYKLKSRLTQEFGHVQEYKGRHLWHFPKPEDLLSISDAFRENNQFSRSKVKYLMNIAQAFVEGSISMEKLELLESFEARQSLLTQVKGIGEWSANYTLMKTLHQPEAIPYGDTGLTQALFNLGIIKDRKDRPAIEAFFETVKGWEAYTSFYLWRSLT